MNIKKKIKACLLLGSYFDTIGFWNGIFEFNYGNIIKNINDVLVNNYTIIDQYMAHGGFKNVDIKKLIASDDTLLLIATCRALIKGGGIKNYVNEYLNIYGELENPKRVSGITTMRSLKYLKTIKNNDNILSLIKSEIDMGGNGAAIRTMPIGLIYYNNIDKIIEESYISSVITHNFPTGYLGGIVSALFTSFAVQNIKPWLWIDELLKNQNKIIEIITKLRPSSKDKYHDFILQFFSYWEKYKEERLNGILNYRFKSEFIFPKERINKLVEYNDIVGNKYDQFGKSGLTATIIAYDSLLMSIIPEINDKININNPKYSLEHLLYYSCLNSSDSDSVGIIAGSWYGALNGEYEEIKQIVDLEFYDTLIDIYNKII